MSETARLTSFWYNSESPEVSIIVLNFNKPKMTGECIEYLHRNTTGRHFEIIVVDNGSTSEAFFELTKINAVFRIVRLSQNRYFGEGNNIGVEHSRGSFVVFLNNDAFVRENWLDPLISTLVRNNNAGGVGPRFLYPDGRLQEAGAYIDGNGDAIQVGKFDLYHPSDVEVERIVDYVSAACLALRRELFDFVGGFDHVFEPAYYEDVDLCFKISAIGKFIFYCPHSTVVHIENATSTDNRAKLSLHNVVAINRDTFMSRWGEWLRARDEDRTAQLPRLHPDPNHSSFIEGGFATRGKPIAVLYTSYALVPGGGELYLLRAAAALSNTHQVIIATEEQYSHLRLSGLGRDFDLDVSGLRMMKRSELHRLGNIDCFIQMSNEILPPLSGYGVSNFYICQFPFPVSEDVIASRWGNIDSIGEVIVYSQFVEEVVCRVLSGLNLGSKVVRVISPPVVLVPESPSTKALGAPFQIVMIGRFFAGGHNKRHDVAIRAIRRLLDRGMPVELHLIGSLHVEPAHRAYYKELKQLAEGLPVKFHPNAGRSLINQILRQSHVYWHATGFGVDPMTEPERCEHFGISPLEAMSAGCVPFVVGNGGPLEYVCDGQNGFTYIDLDELVDKSADLLASAELYERLSRRARRDAEFFSGDNFARQWRALVLGHSKRPEAVELQP